MQAHGTPTLPREDRGPGSISIVINEGASQENRRFGRGGAAAGAVTRMMRGMRENHRGFAFA